jgi:hypothetical protein
MSSPYHCPIGAMTGPWPILSEYVQAQRTCSGPRSGKGPQPTQAHSGTVGKGQAQRQPIIRRKPWLFWTGVVEGWLRQRVSDGQGHFYSDLVLRPSCSL